MPEAAHWRREAARRRCRQRELPAQCGGRAAGPRCRAQRRTRAAPRTLCPRQPGRCGPSWAGRRCRTCTLSGPWSSYPPYSPSLTPARRPSGRSRAAGARPRPAPSVQGGITAAGWRRPAGEHRALEASPAPPRGPALPVAARTRQGLPARCRLPGAERLLVHCACKSQALAGVSNTQ